MYQNSSDLYRAKQYQQQNNANMQRGNPYAASYAPQQQNNSFDNAYNIGKNVRGFMDKVYAKEHDGMIGDIDLTQQRSSLVNVGKRVTDKELQYMVNNGPTTDVAGSASGKLPSYIDPKVVQQYQSTLPQAVQQGASQVGAATGATTGATAGATEGVLANGVAQGASTIDGMAAASFMPEAELTALNAAGANVGAEMAMAAQPVVEGAGTAASGAAGGAGAAASLTWLAPIALAGWDLSRGDDSLLKRAWKHIF